MNEENGQWVLYLTLSNKLPKNFYLLDNALKRFGHTLVPMTYSTLLNLANESKGLTVICMVSNAQELYRYARKVRKILNLMVQNQTIDLYVLSSFSQINDTATFRRNSSYHFSTLPVELSSFSASLVKSINEKSNNKTKWPGGKSPRPSMLNEL